MSLVNSLLQAIVRVDGEAVVLHVGEKPYVVSPSGQVDLSARGLTFDAVSGILAQVLPTESQEALDEFGAAQYQLPALSEFPHDRFTVVAARGGDDVWVEIRRRRIPENDQVPEELFPSARVAGESMGRDDAAGAGREDDLSLPAADQLWPAHPIPGDEAPLVAPAASPRETVAPIVPAPAASAPAPPASPERPAEMSPAPPAPAVAPPLEQTRPPTSAAPPVAPMARPARPHIAAGADGHQPPLVTAVPAPAATTPVSSASQGAQHAKPATTPVAASQPPLVTDVSVPETPPLSPPPQPAPPPVSAPRAPRTSAAGVPPPRAPGAPPPTPPAAVPAARAAADPASAPPARDPDELSQPAVVLPLTRNPIRPDAPPPLAGDALAGLDRLLRLAAVRGASTLYLSSAARPSVRVDGDIQLLEGAPVLGPNDVESLLLTLMPGRSAEALRTGVTSEWISEVADVGRVRCTSFRDHRGPGGVFRIMPPRAVTAEQLGLSREIQALAMEPEGLVLVAGPRSSGKRTLVAALVDLINRTRRDHVITIEREINVVHERTGSLVSQREVQGSVDDMIAAARAALREDPDVLVLEDLRSAGLMSLALEAAASGQLVVGGFPAHTTSGAIDRAIDLYPPEQRQQVQLSLAQHLRGVVAQVLLRKNGGGLLAARELLLNTPAVASVLTEGRTSQLPLAIEGGRKHGMVPLNDALVGFVQSGAVDVREAYRRAADRPGFLALLKRQGLDTSAIERFA